jgi:hypothetical protein
VSYSHSLGQLSSNPNKLWTRRWWFASKAVPILAATIGPLANVLSIAAIVTSWRTQLQNNGELPEGADALGVGIRDPHWLVTPYPF